MLHLVVARLLLVRLLFEVLRLLQVEVFPVEVLVQVRFVLHLDLKQEFRPVVPDLGQKVLHRLGLDLLDYCPFFKFTPSLSF